MKQLCIHTMKYYTAMKKEEPLIQTVTEMHLLYTNVKQIRKQTQKSTCYMTAFF